MKLFENLNPAVRNIGIIAVIALLVVAIPGGGSGADTVVQAISLLFLGSMAWVASRLYREHRVALYSLGDQRRSVLYVALGVATVTLSASSKLLNSGPGTVAWVVLIGACVYAVFAVIWAAREY